MPDSRPLAERLRPQGPSELIWPVNPGANILKERLEKGLAPPSTVLYGRPGTGKTSLARILVRQSGLISKTVSAIQSGARELRQIGEESQKLHQSNGTSMLVFIDEFHRLNRAQQDVLLPFVESGCLILIGATTENPSFEINAALLSRVLVIHFPSHDAKSLISLGHQAMQRVLGKLDLQDEALAALANAANGDARWFLSRLEELQHRKINDSITLQDLETLLPVQLHYHDKDKDQHYDLISVLHKSVRASDVQGTLYWLGRMLEAGEDRRYLLRRLIRMATEDVGLADPEAVGHCIHALNGFEALGSPEGDLLLYQAFAYVAASPKSNAIYKAEKLIRQTIRNSGQLEVPLQYRNAATRWMKEEGYGQDYIYDHDVEYHCAGQSTLPARLETFQSYTPTGLGFEREMNRRMAFWRKRRRHHE